MTTRSSLLLLALLLFGSDIVDAQNVWQALPTLHRGSATAFGRSAATGTIIAAAAEQGLYRSTDEGATWERADTATPLPLQEMISALSWDDRIFWMTTTAGELRRSIDDGISWQLVARLDPYQPSPFNLFVEDDLLIVGPHRSTDRGGTWTENRTVVKPAFTFRMNELLFTGSNPLLKSTDDGASWERVSDPNTPFPSFHYAGSIGDSLILLSGLHLLLISGDTGRTWQQREHAGWSRKLGTVRHGNQLYVMLDTNVVRTTDNGISWEPISPTLFSGWSMLATDSVILVGATGLLRSTDDGETWRQTGLLAPRDDILAAPDISDVRFDDDTIWVLNESGLFTLGPDETAFRLRRQLIGGARRAFIRFGADTVEVAVDHDFHLTTDGGRSWTVREKRYESPTTFWVGPWLFNSGLQRSSDSGKRWENIGTALALQVGASFHLGAAIDSTLFAFVQTDFIDRRWIEMYRSSDFGETWDLVEEVFPRFYPSLRKIDGRMMVSGYKIYHSDDDGVTWDSVAFADTTEFITSYGYGNGVYLAGLYTGPDFGPGGALLRYSNDDGASWHSVVDGLPDTLLNSLGPLCVVDMGVAWNRDRFYLYGVDIYSLDASALSAVDVTAGAARSSRVTAYPNPSRDRILLRYVVTDREHVRIDLYDPLGRSLGRLVDEVRDPGTYLIAIDPSTAADGTTICTFRAGTTTETIILQRIR